MKATDILLALAMSLGALTAMADNSVVSPYSRFGYGFLSDQANTAQSSMGGVGVAMRSGRAINFMNPASYAAIDSLTFLFDMGCNVQYLTTSEEGARGHNFTGGVNYITMQVPLCKWAGASAGLLPWSEVGYSFGQEIVNGTNSRTGSGSINQLYLGLAAKPFQGLTVGANISYLFGTTVNDVYVYTDNASTSLFERSITVRDWMLRLGIQYGFEVSPGHNLTLGVIYQPEKKMHGHTMGIKYDISLDSAPDTIADIQLRSAATTPALWGAGVNYRWGERLMVEADFSFQPWSKAKFATIPGFDNTSGFADRWKINAGVQYVPDYRGSYAKRISYRVGAYYTHDYLRVHGNDVRERGITLGVGLPTPLSKTVVNLSLDYRHRQATPMPLVKENYLVLTLGVNFNELWFWRNKIR